MAIPAATAAVLASDNDAVFASDPFDSNVFFFLFNGIRRLGWHFDSLFYLSLSKQKASLSLIVSLLSTHPNA